MAVLYYIRDELGGQKPVYTLDDDALQSGIKQTYLDICLETAADGASCDYVRYNQPGGPYVFADGAIDYASYMRDTMGVTGGKNYERWGRAYYKVGNVFVNKIFDDERKLFKQEIFPDVQSPFETFVKIGITIAAMSALGPIATKLGASMIGPNLAAQYPALASAIGNTFLQTAANGGDVEKAVTSVATGFVGGQVGSFAQGVSDSQVIGKIAAGATSSIISGGNILPAIASPIISSVANDVISNLSTPSGGSMMDFDYSGDYDYSSVDVPDVAYSTDPVFSFDGNFSDMVDYNYAGPIDTGMPPIKTDFSPDYFPDAGGVFTFGDFGGFGDTSSNYHDPAYDDTSGGGDYIPGLPGVTPEINFPDSSSIPDPSIFLPDFQTSGGSNVPTTSGGTDWGAALARLGTIALQVYQQQGNKNIKAVSQSVRLPDGSVQVVNKNGTVTTRTPSGQTTTTQLPPGQPYRFPDGSVVMNNGNGTYTQQTASGQIATQQYGSLGAGGMGGVSLPILAGGALLLLLVMKK